MLALLNPYRVHIYFAIFRPIIVVKRRVFMLWCRDTFKRTTYYNSANIFLWLRYSVEVLKERKEANTIGAQLYLNFNL